LTAARLAANLRAVDLNVNIERLLNLALLLRRAAVGC
jgi:hypothetical protein